MTDPYLEIDDESSRVHRTPAAALTPLSIPMEETVLLPPVPPIIEKPCGEIPTIKPELIDDSTIQADQEADMEVLTTVSTDSSRDSNSSPNRGSSQS